MQADKDWRASAQYIMQEGKNPKVMCRHKLRKFRAQVRLKGTFCSFTKEQNGFESIWVRKKEVYGTLSSLTITITHMLSRSTMFPTTLQEIRRATSLPPKAALPFHILKLKTRPYRNLSTFLSS